MDPDVNRQCDILASVWLTEIHAKKNEWKVCGQILEFGLDDSNDLRNKTANE